MDAPNEISNLLEEPSSPRWAPPMATLAPVRLPDGRIFDVLGHMAAILADVDRAYDRPALPALFRPTTPTRDMTEELLDRRFNAYSRIWQVICASQMVRYGVDAVFVVGSRFLLTVHHSAGSNGNINAAQVWVHWKATWRRCPHAAGGWGFADFQGMPWNIGPLDRLVDMQTIYDELMMPINGGNNGLGRILPEGQSALLVSTAPQLFYPDGPALTFPPQMPSLAGHDQSFQAGIPNPLGPIESAEATMSADQQHQDHIAEFIDPRLYGDPNEPKNPGNDDADANRHQ
jgi:hypothetical protein